MKEDLVSAQVLLVFCVGLTVEEEKVKVICGWVRESVPFYGFYRLAEACSGRVFPRSLRELE